jgi:hypothetical protein
MFLKYSNSAGEVTQGNKISVTFSGISAVTEYTNLIKAVTLLSLCYKMFITNR